MVYKGMILHKSSTAYLLAQDSTVEGRKKFEKHMKDVLNRYKELMK